MIWGEGGGLEKELSRCQGTTGGVLPGTVLPCGDCTGTHRVGNRVLYPYRSPQPHSAAPTLVRGVSCLSGSSRVNRGEL